MTHAPNRMAWSALVATVALAALAACGRGPHVSEDASGLALPALELPDAGPSLAVDAAVDGETAAETGPPLFEFQPPELMVYRSTAVHFKAAPPAGHEAAACEWNFGDGLPIEEGCVVSHTFHGGNADERVTVTFRDGAWSFAATRIVPLERLPVSVPSDRPDPQAGTIPAKPKAGPTSFRAVLLADLGPGDLELCARRVIELGADLAIVVGGAAQSDDASPWEHARSQLAEPLRTAGVPVLWGMSPADLASGPEVRRPSDPKHPGPSGDLLDLADGEHFPERWAIAFHGAYLAFVSGATLDDGALDWLRARLAEAQIYESRIVFSYLPLHPFSERGPAAGSTLGPKFKVYELLLRARATAFVSAGHRAYFKGRYGALPVVSVGPVTGPGERLAGHDFEQPASIVVLDVDNGVPSKIFALEGPGFAQVLDEGYLPETVEVYTR
ncbi:MAG: PKD domain-containing protein [Myxococcota bacterium]